MAPSRRMSGPEEPGPERWEALFDDLEAMADADQRAVLDADVADRTRAETAALTLPDRLRGNLSREIVLELSEAGPVAGTIQEVATGWVLLGGPRTVLVPLATVVTVTGLGAAAATVSAAARPLPITVVLRGLARDRATVRAQLIGSRRLEGTIDRVGGDHFDLAEHPADEPRRPASVRRVVSVPITALICLTVL